MPSGAQPLRAWVADATERECFETGLRRLAGRRIERLRYTSLSFAPRWTGDGFDAIDFGLELSLDAGSGCSFTWQHHDINVGLLAYPGDFAPNGPPISQYEHVSAWDATEQWDGGARTKSAT